jgi:hypothetical protein
MSIAKATAPVVIHELAKIAKIPFLYLTKLTLNLTII